jgi:hypothetical protein
VAAVAGEGSSPPSFLILFVLVSGFLWPRSSGDWWMMVGKVRCEDAASLHLFYTQGVVTPRWFFEWEHRIAGEWMSHYCSLLAATWGSRTDGNRHGHRWLTLLQGRRGVLTVGRQRFIAAFDCGIGWLRKRSRWRITEIWWGSCACWEKLIVGSHYIVIVDMRARKLWEYKIIYWSVGGEYIWIS